MAAQFQLTDDGVVVPTEAELVERFGSRQLANVDGLIEIHDKSINGQQNATFGASLMEVAELIVDLVAGMDPGQATGFMLRAACALTGVTKNPATYSTVDLTLSLDSGATVPAGSRVSVDGNGEAVFVTDTALTAVPFAGDYPMTATAQTAGPVFAPAGNLTVIETVETGWTAVTNAADAAIGLAEETDEALRIRRAETLVAQGGATLDAIVAELLGVTGVTDVAAFENVGDTTDGDGIPAHSFEAVVVGGTDAAVAASVWQNKPAGIRAHGTTTESVTDSQGFDHDDIGLTRPTELRLYVVVFVSETTDGAGPDEAAIQAALVTASETRTHDAYLGVGADVYSLPLLCVVREQDRIKNAQINIGFSPISFDGSINSQQLPVTGRQRATLDTSDITFVGP